MGTIFKDPKFYATIVTVQLIIFGIVTGTDVKNLVCPSPTAVTETK